MIESPTVRTIEPGDCNPAFLAWTWCRSAISSAAARHARDGDRETAKAMIALMDERLAMGDRPARGAVGGAA